jgi:hypothetical protein
MMRCRSARNTKAFDWKSRPLVKFANMKHLNFHLPGLAAVAAGLDVKRLWKAPEFSKLQIDG